MTPQRVNLGVDASPRCRRLLGRRGPPASEPYGLAATITAWWPPVEVLIVTGVTNARTEAANTAIKNVKRTGRAYRNPDHYKARILLASAARTVA